MNKLAITLEQAKSLKKGQILNPHPSSRLFKRFNNTDGTPLRYVVTSVKTWKTMPWCVRVRAKHGLCERIEIHEDLLCHFVLQS